MAKATMFIARMPITATPRTMSSVAMRGGAATAAAGAAASSGAAGAARSVIWFPLPDGERSINQVRSVSIAIPLPKPVRYEPRHVRMAGHGDRPLPALRRWRSRAAGTRVAAGETLPRACGPAPAAPEPAPEPVAAPVFQPAAGLSPPVPGRSWHGCGPPRAAARRPGPRGLLTTRPIPPPAASS